MKSSFLVVPAWAVFFKIPFGLDRNRGLQKFPNPCARNLHARLQEKLNSRKPEENTERNHQKETKIQKSQSSFIQKKSKKLLCFFKEKTKTKRFFYKKRRKPPTRTTTQPSKGVLTLPITGKDEADLFESVAERRERFLQGFYLGGFRWFIFFVGWLYFWEIVGIFWRVFVGFCWGLFVL